MHLAKMGLTSKVEYSYRNAKEKVDYLCDHFNNT